MNTPSSHCPGFEQFRNLKSFVCTCQHCGEEIEIFSDEFSREHVCRKCQKKIDFSKCAYTGGGEVHSAR